MSAKRFLGLVCWACVLASSLLLLGVVGASAQSGSYKILRRMTVGGDGSWDYLRVDPDAHRIYVARSTHLMIVDENTGKVIGDIPDTKGIHGVALVQDLNKGFTSNGGDKSVTVFDLKTLKTIEKISIDGENPDSITYDPVTKRVFTLNGGTKDSTAIDPATDKVVGTVVLGGKPEEPTMDGKGTMFVNLEDKSAIVAIDTKSLKITGGPWPLAPCEGPSALAMDQAHRRLFAACGNMVGVMNADNGKVVASPPIGGDPDGDGFDPATGMIFATCRQGVLSIIHEDSPDKYTVVGNIDTQFGARTMTYDPKTHHVFTETADFSAAPPATPDNPRPRPQQVAGSFVILELGPQ
jgi:DNA-binding beta-propeller fold protein YncE